MIISCPACQTRYNIPEDKIGPKGRAFRCAKCNERWTQFLNDTHNAEDKEGSQAEEKLDPPKEPKVILAKPKQKTIIPPKSWAFFRREQKSRPLVETDFEFRRAENLDRPKKNNLKIWLSATGVFFLSTIAAILATNISGFPKWLPMERPVLGAQNIGLQLDFPSSQQETKSLADGTKYLEVNGIVSNPTTRTLDIPGILTVLHNQEGEVVYTWEIVPQKRRLLPGETITITEVMLDVPDNIDQIEIGWKPR